MCHSCRVGGSRERAAFQEYCPLPTSMATGDTPPEELLSSPRACDIRIEELLSRIPRLVFSSRWVWIGGECCGESSLKVGACGAGLCAMLRLKKMQVESWAIMGGSNGGKFCATVEGTTRIGSEAAIFVYEPPGGDVVTSYRV